MPICKICHKPVTSGVVVHSECYEELNNFDNTQSKLLLIKISELRKENTELKARLEKAIALCPLLLTENQNGKQVMGLRNVHRTREAAEQAFKERE